MKAGRRMRFTIGFACSYLILLIIPVIMGISTYHNYMRLSRSSVITTNEVTLRQLGESLYNSLENAGQFAFSISSMEHEIISLYNMDKRSGQQVYAVRSAIEDLPIHLDSNGITNDYYIIDFKSDIILSPHVGFLTSYAYYKSQVSATGVDYSVWYDSLLNPTSSLVQVLKTENGNPLLYYCYPYGTFSYAKPLCSIVFTLDLRMLDQLLNPILELGIDQVYILNNAGELLLSAGSKAHTIPKEWFEETDFSSVGSFEQHVNGEQMLISNWRNKYFTLVTMVPQGIITGQAQDVLRTILIYLLLFLLAEILLCLWIIRYNQQPVVHILDHLEDNCTDQRFPIGLNAIEHVVESLSSNAKQLENSLNEQRLLMRTAYINRLVYGDIINESEMEKQMEQVGFNIEGSLMRGIYMHWKTELPPAHTLSILCVSVIKMLDEYGPELQFIHLNSAHRFALLYAVPEPEDDHHADLLQTIYSRLKLEMNIDVSFYIGYSCTQINLVHESFAAAAVLMNSTSDEDERFLFEVDDSMPQHEANHNLMGEEQKLINLLEVGNIKEIEVLLNKMFEQYFRNSHMDEFERKLFYYRMIGALVSVSGEQMLTPELRYSTSSLSPEQFFKLVRAYCEKICQQNMERKLQQANELISKIVEYIDQNFTNPEISLYSVAVKFSLTESYLSLLIKEKLGETFSSRVERLRIEKANQLLLETDLLIDVISEQVGYANTNTFRRAFHRVQGCSPSDYRANKHN